MPEGQQCFPSAQQMALGIEQQPYFSVGVLQQVSSFMHIEPSMHSIRSPITIQGKEKKRRLKKRTNTYMDPTQKWPLYLYYSLFKLKLVGLASLEIKFSCEFCPEEREWCGQFWIKQRNINPAVILSALDLWENFKLMVKTKSLQAYSFIERSNEKHSLIWAKWVCAAEEGLVFRVYSLKRCEQGVFFGPKASGEWPLSCVGLSRLCVEV